MLPKNRPPTHPGAMILKEFIEPINMTQKDLAKHLGWTYARLNEIIHAKRGVSANSALALADAFEIEPDFWLNLQKNWDLWHAMQGHKHIEPLKDKAA